MNRMCITSEQFFNLLLLVFSSFFLYHAFHITEDSGLGSSASIPIMSCSVMVMASLMALGKSIFSSVRPVEKIPRAVFLVLLMILLYSLFLEDVGFLISSLVFIGVLVFAINGSRLVTSFALALLVVLVTYLVFRIVFKVMLPEGMIPEREILFYLKNLFN